MTDITTRQGICLHTFQILKNIHHIKHLFLWHTLSHFNCPFLELYYPSTPFLMSLYDNRRFSQMFEKISFSEEDHLFLLGDLFDRNFYEPDPVGVYFNALKWGDRCTVIRGNHDAWLAKYIIDYFVNISDYIIYTHPVPFIKIKFLPPT